MAKFRPGQLVKLAPERCNQSAGILAWLAPPHKKSDCILIKPGMVGMLIKERRRSPGSWYKYGIFLFEEKFCLVREDSLVAVESEEQ